MRQEPKYIVLRDLTSKPESAATRPLRPDSPLGPPKGLTKSLSQIHANSLKAMKSNLTLDVGVDRKDAEDARRDKRTLGIALPMPTALIAPTAAGSGPDSRNVSWGVAEVGALKAPVTGAGVTVAVLDTGIDRKHAAFAGLMIEEQDFSGEGNGDKEGHGTHCAATIFGRDVAGFRIGVAPGVERALIGKVLRSDGGGDTAMLFKGLEWAINANADVISMSLGFDFPGYVNGLVADGWPADLATSDALVSYRDNLRLFDNLMQRVRLLANQNSGSIVVAAAGNESKAGQEPNYRIAVSLPAAALGLISVGALQKHDDGLSVADFSNTMPRLTAPGVSIRSAQFNTKSDLVVMSGTSMACPHVAGVAALWWEQLRKEGNASAGRVEAKLLANAKSNVFRTGVEPLDRGDGMVTAPVA
ncbi:S8 family serine peptidase [Mesorhizobium sp. M1322]|uniref:S8 family peptidase n=1 Tax=Mesorhizobium sp. M1322 TaxID=2957081 RepID=UPI003335D3AB